MLKTNSDYSHTVNKLGHDKRSLIPSSSRNFLQVQNILNDLRFISQSQIIYCQGNDTFLHIQFFFQRATGGIESAVYNKLIAPFKDDLPATHLVGFRRVCADHKYAYLGPNILSGNFTSLLSCKMFPLPETSYREPWAFIISKNSPYKDLINWR
jgi:hypothetical protein